MNSYTVKDMVDVVDAAGNAIEGMPSVPKAWLDTDLVPVGTKKGKQKSDDGGSSSDSSGSSKPERKSGEEPPRNGAGSSTDEWVAYAREKGAKDADLLDDTAEPLNREALIEKYGTAAE